MTGNIGQVDSFNKYAEVGAYHWVRTHDAPPWRRGVRLLSRYDLAARQVGRHVCSPAKGLDVGCGDGFLIYRLARQGYAVTGIDMSEEGLKHAEHRLKSLGVEASVLRASAYELPVEDASQDFVTALEIIEHLDEPGRLAREVFRVLKPEGVFVCSTPQRAPGQHPAEVRDPYHVKEYVARELEEQLRAVFGSVMVLGGFPTFLDTLYRPSTRGRIMTKSIRLCFRASAMFGLNPYLWCSSPARPSDQLLIGVAVKK